MQDKVRPAVAGEGGSAPADDPRGFVYALLTYLLWGFLPFYMKAVAHVPVLEVVVHRVLWSVPIAGVVLLALGRTADIAAALRSPRTLAMAALTAGILTVNWGTYIWAIIAGRTVEAALGYYINPLMSMFLGAVLLGERFSRLQLAALALAVVAVVLLTVEAGGLPWVSLVLAVTFAVYGFLRKTLPVGPAQGFFLEVLLLSAPALAFAAWLQITGEGHFLDSGADTALLMLAGPVTAVPLLLYAFGAKLLRISTIGLMQYISPTMIAVIGVFAFGEPFGPGRMVAFALIWAALALYMWPVLFGRKAD